MSIFIVGSCWGSYQNWNILIVLACTFVGAQEVMASAGVDTLNSPRVAYAPDAKTEPKEGKPAEANFLLH